MTPYLVTDPSFNVTPNLGVTDPSFNVTPNIVVTDSSFNVTPNIVVTDPSFNVTPNIVVTDPSFNVTPNIVVTDPSYNMTPYLVSDPAFRVTPNLVVVHAPPSCRATVGVEGFTVDLSLSCYRKPRGWNPVETLELLMGQGSPSTPTPTHSQHPRNSSGLVTMAIPLSLGTPYQPDKTCTIHRGGWGWELRH